MSKEISEQNIWFLFSNTKWHNRARGYLW